MTPNLTPTQITDINGRTTTVHKRLDAPQSARKTLNVPAPSLGAKKPAAAPSRTPIDMPKPLHATEVQYFMAWQKGKSKNVKLRSEIMEMFSTPMDEEAMALAWRVGRAGTVQEGAAFNLLARYHQRRTPKVARAFKISQEKALKTLTTSLLLVEKIGQDNPQVQPDDIYAYTSRIEKVVDAYGYSPKVENRVALVPIETKEELASMAAVATFILDSANRNGAQHTDTSFVCADGTKVNGSYIANRSLDAYLRENPRDVNKVLDYVADRKLGNTVKDTKALVDYLKDTEGNNAVNEGWL